MEYIKKDLGSYKLHLIKTDKFKSIFVRVSFHRVVKKNEITIRNILSDMFMQSSKKYGSKRELTIKAQDLYAAGLKTSNSRLGNYINTDFYLTTLHDKYTEEGNFAASLEFLSEIMFNPDVEDGKFNAEKLDIVKSNCRSALNSIKEDVKWLGFDWDNLYFASDYFEEMYNRAVLLIKKGKAYVCDLTSEEMREYRGTLTEPGKESPYRNRSVEENLELFEKMADLFGVSTDYLLGREALIRSTNSREFVGSMSQDDISLITELRHYNNLYTKLTKDTKRYVNLINKKMMN